MERFDERSPDTDEHELLRTDIKLRYHSRGGTLEHRGAERTTD